MGLTISLNRVSFLPPPVRNNIFYEIETLGLGPPYLPPLLRKSGSTPGLLWTKIIGPYIWVNIYIFLNIGLRPKLGNTYYHIMGRSPSYGRNSNIFHITNGLNSLHRKWYTGNQCMVKSTENRMRSNLEGCRTFRNQVVPYLDRDVSYRGKNV